MIARALDRAIGVFAPAWAAKRMQLRATMSQIESFTGGAGAGYDAGKTTRLNCGSRKANLNENAIPQGQIHQLRAQAWNQYRNNPHGRKIVRSLQAKVIGRGLTPHSQATKADGTAHVEFRARAQALWTSIGDRIDYRGRPGRGGDSLAQIQKAALRAVILDGEILFRLRPLGPAEQLRRQLPLPLVLQLIHAERLDASRTEVGANGTRTYRGIEFNADGERTAYWILDYHPSDPVAGTDNLSRRIPAAEIGHLFLSDDVDQMRGVTWFCSLLTQMRDTADYQHNELVNSAMSACFVAGIRRPSGGASAIGLNGPSDWDLTDVNGNPVNNLAPGMFLNLGRDGEFDSLRPERSMSNPEAWIGHLVRSVAAGAPGIKASTLTGDYRNSSFSSERSADNDVWPEVEEVQDWFAAEFCQPIYEEVTATAVTAGLFDGVVSAEEFAARRDDFLRATWQGPICRSIQPTADAEASRMRVKGATSSPQRETAMLGGGDWREVLTEFAEFREFAVGRGLPEALVDQMLGLEAQDTAAVTKADAIAAAPAGNGQDDSGGTDDA